MIQRQQSVYLFLISVICLIMSFGDICLYQGKAINKAGLELDYRIHTTSSQVGLGADSPIQQYEIPFSMVLVSLLSLIAILMYSNLKRQLTLVTMNFGAILIVLINVYLIKGKIGGIKEITFQSLGLNWPIFLLLVLIILNFLAARGIKKDIDLLASADRLR